jgi:hypothetical protein
MIVSMSKANNLKQTLMRMYLLGHGGQVLIDLWVSVHGIDQRHVAVRSYHVLVIVVVDVDVRCRVGASER